MNAGNEVRQRLNGIVEDLGAIMGYTATSTLIDYLGGTSLYVPKQATPGHVIARLVGVSAMCALCREFGDTTLNLPIDYRRERSVRSRLIGALLLRDVLPRDIATIAGVSIKSVTLARNELEKAGLLPYIIGSEKVFLIDDIPNQSAQTTETTSVASSDRNHLVK